MQRALPDRWPTAKTLLLAALLIVRAPSAQAEQTYRDFDSPPHNYSTRVPTDRFTRLMTTLEGDPRLDRSNEKAFLVSFLQILGIPASSQMLVFSTTSLQLRFITPFNPRALYFNEDLYIGYIPGGRLEVVGLDPELGAIFYIFDLPKDKSAIRFERSDRCMNCHAGEDTGFVPGLVVKSVVPGPGGGSLDAFRVSQTGHGIPLSDRFGGWHVTGMDQFTNHWGNLTGRFVAGELITYANKPGQRFDFAKYPVATSDILAHLLHEHQAGFVNRVVEAGYRTRTALQLSGGKLSTGQLAELDEQARLLTRYLLFAEEAPLPPGGIAPDATYQADFLAGRRASPDGLSLKDLDLKTRLFKHRCSYMIYSAVFEGLPREMRGRVYQGLKSALAPETSKDFAYLSTSEKSAIREILKSTLKDLPGDW